MGGGTSPFVFPASARRFLNQLPGAGYSRMVIASLSRNIYHSNMTCEKVWNFIGATHGRCLPLTVSLSIVRYFTQRQRRLHGQKEKFLLDRSGKTE